MSADPCPECPVTNLGLGGRGAHLVVPSMIAPILACFLVANRIYWRLKMVGSLGPDDVSTMFAMVFLYVQCGASIAAVNFGYGRNLDTLSLHQASEALKCFFLLQIFYKLAINCTKLSILFLYLRIFTDRLRFVRACWCLIVLVLCACTCFTTATIFQCSPVNAAWERWKPGSSCVDVYALWYSNAIYNIMTDFVIVLMVPPVIFNLKLPIRQKLALTCVFGLGVIVCAASISRLTTLYSSAYGNDATAGSLVSTIWTTIEAGLGVICANLPMLRTPLQHFFPKIFSHRASTNQILSTNLSQTADLHEDGSIPSPMLTAVPNSGRDAGLPNHPCAARNATCPPVHAESLHDEHTTSRHFGYFNNCSSSTAEEYSPTFSQTMMHPKAGRTEDWYNRQQQVW